MKKILLLSILTCLLGTVFGQIIYTPMYGPYEFKKLVRFDSAVMHIGFADTATANLYKVQGVFIKTIPGVQIRVGNSFLMRNAAATAWLEFVNTGPGSNSCLEGLKGGTGVVTKLTDSTFHISGAEVVKNCVTYQTRDTTIKISQPGDTGRVDIFIAPINGNTTWIQGTEGSTQNFSYSSDTAIVLGFVLVTDTAVTLSTSIDVHWTEIADKLYEIPGNGVQVNGRITATAGGGLDLFSSTINNRAITINNTSANKSWAIDAPSDSTLSIVNTTGSQTLLKFSKTNKIIAPTVTNQLSSANRMVVKDTVTGILGTQPIPGGGTVGTLLQVTTLGNTTDQGATFADSDGNHGLTVTDGTDPILLLLNGGSGGDIQVIDPSSSKLTEITPNALILTNSSNRSSTIHADNIASTNKTLQLPNVNNQTLAVSVNGNFADANGDVTISAGSGTVTSVAFTAPTSLFTVTGSPITSSGTIAATLTNAASKTVFGNSSGSTGAPSYVTLDSSFLTGMHTENYFNTKYAPISVINNTNSGSSFRLLTASTQAIKTVSNGYGVLIDSATSNTINFKLDSATVYTYVRSLVGGGGATDTLSFNNSQFSFTALSAHKDTINIVGTPTGIFFAGSDSAMTTDANFTWDGTTLAMAVSGSGAKIDGLGNNLSIQTTTNTNLGDVAGSTNINIQGNSAGDNITINAVNGTTVNGGVIASIGAASFTVNGTVGQMLTTAGAGSWAIGDTDNGTNYIQANHTIDDITMEASSLVINNAAVQMNHYTAGAATFDGSGNITSVSDRRAKHNIIPFTYGLNAINKLKTSSFIYNNDTTNTLMSGFIAQDVQKAIPIAVHSKTKDGMLSLETNAILAALVNAIHEQQKEIQSLKKQIKKIKK